MTTPIDRLTAAIDPDSVYDPTEPTTVRTDDLALVLAVVEAAQEVCESAPGEARVYALQRLRAALAAIEGSTE
jgi:hypothetical protein